MSRTLPKKVMRVTTDQPAFLIETVQKLSKVHSLDEITEIVRQAARQLVNADGATFVLRERGNCYYADEDAIGPLWKGLRFPLEICISGWVMLNKQQVVIPDIYADNRIPHEAYRPTFVKGLVMTPIRQESPVGAIGTYWATNHRATLAECEQLQILANTTSVAIENVNLYNELEDRVKQRTHELQLVNKELEAFSRSVSHDLQGSLGGIKSLLEIVLSNNPNVSAQTKEQMELAIGETGRTLGMVQSLLRLSRISYTQINKSDVDMTDLAEQTVNSLKISSPYQAAITVQPGMTAHGDRDLLKIVFDNLLSNALKYSSKTAEPQVEVGQLPSIDGMQTFFVRDNGVGFDSSKAMNLFGAFSRYHNPEDYPGNGVGLATVQRVIHKHCGEIWVESKPKHGATFLFKLPVKSKDQAF